MLTLRERICTESLRWRGAVWHHRALVLYRYCDCVRLLEGVAKTLGLIDATWLPPIYSAEFHLHRSDAWLERVLLDLGCTPVLLEARQPGDILGMQFGRCVSHLGIAMPGNTLLHASRSDGAVVHHGLRGDWLDRLCCVYAFPGVQA